MDLFQKKKKTFVIFFCVAMLEHFQGHQRVQITTRTNTHYSTPYPFLLNVSIDISKLMERKKNVERNIKAKFQKKNNQKRNLETLRKIKKEYMLEEGKTYHNCVESVYYDPNNGIKSCHDPLVLRTNSNRQ